MVTIVTILHIFVCVFLILVVLLQAGKGGGMGLAFGSSGAQTVFGGSGAGNFLTKLTAGTAVVFMLTSLTLAYFASAQEGTWLEEHEKQTLEQKKREKAARDKLAAPAPAAPAEGGGGDKAAAPATDGAAPAEGTAPASGAAPAAPGAAPAPASGAAPAPASGAAP